jgi:hypothetical protein
MKRNLLSPSHLPGRCNEHQKSSVRSNTAGANLLTNIMLLQTMSTFVLTLAED